MPLAAVTSSAAAALEDALSLLDESGPNLLLDAGLGDHEATEKAFAAAAHPGGTKSCTEAGNSHTSSTSQGRKTLLMPSSGTDYHPPRTRRF
jgi:hypothetical protein